MANGSRGSIPKYGGGQGGRDYWTECNSWVYTFHVQHDVEGLAKLFGGRDKLAAKLDALFTEPRGRAEVRLPGQVPGHDRPDRHVRPGE